MALLPGNVATMPVRHAKYEVYGVMERAVTAWAGVVNARGGIGGRRVRVESGDDANGPVEHVPTSADVHRNCGGVHGA